MRREQAGLRGISGDSGRKVACLRAGKRRIRYQTPASCKNQEAGLGKNPPLRLARCKGESAGRVEKPGENRREEWRGKTNDKGEIMPAGMKEGRWGRERTGPGTALLPTRNPPAPQARRCLGITRAWSQTILEGQGPLDSAQRGYSV